MWLGRGAGTPGALDHTARAPRLSGDTRLCMGTGARTGQKSARAP